MRHLSFLRTTIFSATLLLAGCVPPPQYEPLTLTSLDLGQSRKVSVQAGGLWRDTGISVHRGEVYKAITQGMWSPGGFCGQVTAAGLEAEHIACMKGIFYQSFPLPEGKIGALVGRVGAQGQVFLIGDAGGFIADQDGTLFVRMNDPDGFMFDNSGQIDVAIQHYKEGVAPATFQATQDKKSLPAQKKSTSYKRLE
ncbi:MAG: hypothetical protein HON65_04100 [Rhodospirillales bacterium]|jgi:hypothetical protein|nr:hypothetical protein [Rhodospirillales bacterium]